MLVASGTAVPPVPPHRAGIAGQVWAAVATLAAPALRLMLRGRAARGKEIAARLAERRGVDPTPRPIGKLLWLHAASVGEAVSALPVIQALPHDITVLFTTGTVTSARLLARRLQEMELDHRVIHRFVPLDVPAWCARFLDHWRPDGACFMESELWPNTLRACAARGVPAVLLNARMSVRSAARWCNLPGFAAEVLGRFTWIAAQSEADAGRLRSLGGLQVEAPGNLKFAAPLLPADAVELARLASILGAAPRWVAASTHPGDEARAAAIHCLLAPQFPGLVTAIVPRHPERGAGIARDVAKDGIAVTRRAIGQDPAPGIWVADTLGELGLIYRLFPIVLIGKSFPPGGGQNPLEPARLDCAIACGPSMENFGDAIAALRAEGALAVVETDTALAGWVAEMLTNPACVPRRGAAASRAARRQADLPARMAAKLAALL